VPGPSHGRDGSVTDLCHGSHLVEGEGPGLPRACVSRYDGAVEESGPDTGEEQPVGGPLRLEQDVTLNWSSLDEIGSARARVAILLRTRAWLDLLHADTSIAGLEPGRLVRLGFQCSADGYCAADVRFLEVVREQPLRIAVERPLHATPVQRRAFFRLRVHLPLKIADASHAELDGHGSAVNGRDDDADSDDDDGLGGAVWGEAEPEPSSWAVSGYTEDVSGGGLRFVANTGVHVHERVDLQLGCPPGTWLRIGAEVVRLEPISNPIEPADPDAPFGVALAFVRIAQRDQDRIVAYLFECQRQLRRRP
jgi:hypothetical protein